jgi:RNA polymerase sigma-70 factor, ECF subfamily
MALPVETRATLLLRIRDPQNKEAWREFIDLYHPLISAVASKFGLQSADAEELSQNVLMTVMQKQEQYRPNGQTGSFRRWLATVARNAAISQLRSRNRLPVIGGTDAMLRIHEQVPAPADDMQTEYLQEEQKQLFAWASEQVQSRSDPTTWSAFWLTTITQLSVEETAKQLNMTTGQVYVARSRILKRLRETVQQYTDLIELSSPS